MPPFANTTIALGLSPIGATGPDILARLVDEACAAEDAGFDGVTLSEHHAGFEHYLPSPLLLSAYLLSRLRTAWAVACPAILPLRPAVLVAEELAWLHAAYPARVGAGFVAGYQRQDFAAVGADFDARLASFWTGLGDLMTALGAGAKPSPVAADPAVRALGADGVPLLAGVGGPAGVRRAARLGVGLLLTSLRRPPECGELVRTYTGAGGAGPVVLIRRIHVGTDAAGFAASESAWRSRSDAPAWLAADPSALISGTPEQVATALADAVRASGCTSLNLRLDAHVNDPARVGEQIATVGRDVLPRLRKELGWEAP